MAQPVMIITIIFSLLSLSLLPSTSTASFTLKLIHRDSPLSPLHQPNLSHLQRFFKNVEISSARASYLRQQITSKSAQNVSIRLPARLQDYLFTVEIGIGTPAVKRTLIFDTGSGLTWTQCRPCIKCFKQNEPIFDPKASRSYKAMPKNHPLAVGFRCTPFGCGYFIAYYSGQFSAGKAAVETFTFQSDHQAPVPAPNLVFGCAITSIGSYPPQISGILGMDKEPLSFAHQLGSVANSRRFSYCMTPVATNMTTSYVRFGDEARIRGRNGQTTPFLNNNKKTAILYSLRLIDISINGRNMGLGPAAFPDGCFIDSGASVSLLNRKAYAAVTDYIKIYFSQFKNVRRFVGKNIPKELICYKGFAKFPSMTWHLEGADYHVPASNLFYKEEGNVFCLAVMESRDTTILGAFQQRNVRIVYDLKERKLSFAPEECSRDLQIGS